MFMLLIMCVYIYIDGKLQYIVPFVYLVKKKFLLYVNKKFKSSEIKKKKTQILHITIHNLCHIIKYGTFYLFSIS